MANISHALRRIKQDLEPFLPEMRIRSACRQVGHHWRDRQFDPVATIHLFILQILHFNTSMTHLRRLTKIPINPASYCKARMRLPLSVLWMLLRESARAMGGRPGKAGLWHGLRVWLTDGTCTIAPDTPSSQKRFPQPKDQKKGCGFPQIKILGLIDAFSGLIIEALCFPLYTHEQSKVCKLHPLLGEGDLLVGDRGFCSYCRFQSDSFALVSVVPIEDSARRHSSYATGSIDAQADHLYIMPCWQGSDRIWGSARYRSHILQLRWRS